MASKSKVDVKAKPGDLEAYPHPGLAFPEILKENGVEIFFGVHGGHGWRWIDTSIKSGIKNVTVRHEMQGGHAAEGYARVSGKLGVCFGTAGPGQTNLISGVHQAYLSNTPLLVILAANEQSGDRTYTLQEIEAEKLFSGSAKSVKRLYSPNVYKYWLTRSIREALKPPRGPAVVEVEVEALGAPYPESNKLYVENWLKEPMLPAHPDPIAVERVIEKIYSCDKPVIYAGDEIMWGDAQAELRELVQLAQVPAMGRRGGRGVIQENNPLCWRSAKIGAEADLFISIGGRLDFYDFYGARWEIKQAIQIAEASEYIHSWLPTEIAINANIKVTLKAMIEYIKANKPRLPSGRTAWVENIKEMGKNRKEHLKKRAQKFKDLSPVHPAWLSKNIVDIVNEIYKGDVYYVFDAFTGSNILSPYIDAQFTGQILDSGCHAGVGHGVGMAIGASFGCDKKKMVFSMMGDAGMGLGGMDIETAVRHKLPIVFLVNNNDAWMAGCQAVYGKDMGWYGLPKGEVIPHKFIPDQRYDLMFEAIGCHGEWITKPDQIRDGLIRAFKAAEKGKPAVVNVKVDKRPVQAVLDHWISVAPWTFLPWNETTRWHRKARVKYMAQDFPFDKYGIEAEDYDRWDLTDEDFELGIPE